MLRSSLCDYSNVYIFVNKTTTVLNTVVAGVTTNNKKKNIIIKTLLSIY